MLIAAHKIKGAEFVPAHASGGELKPTLIVLHDTAGRVEKGSSVNWFKSQECNTSAHVVVERDGTVVQMVPFNRRAWHAGASEWQGVTNCNAFSIGIEIVNPGKLDKNGRAWFHKPTEKGFAGVKRAKTTAHGDGWWLPYTLEQIEAVTRLCEALVRAYPDIEDITTHWFISPRRKIDTGPLFPLDDVRVDAFSVRKDAPEIEAVEPARERPVAATMQGSRTLFGQLLASLGVGLLWCKDLVVEAAHQIDLLAPATKLGSGLGFTAASIGFAIAVAGIGLAVYARIDDAHKGRTQ